MHEFPTIRPALIRPAPSSSVNDPPFALDVDYDMSINTARSFDSANSVYSNASGFRSGGPKEHRLRRVALLSPTKVTENLYPVKIEHIPSNASPEKIESTFSKFGDVGDVYIPKNLDKHQPAQDFAVVRFVNKEAAQKVLAMTGQMSLEVDGSPIQVSPLKKQQSTFSNGTGIHGITNEPFDDGTQTKKWDSTQSISLESCRARNGYPWGSKRDLKFLPLHGSPEAFDMFPIKITNLNKQTTPQDLQQYFKKFGTVGDISCPKPLLVSEKTNDPNCGHAIIRYSDRNHMMKAMEALESQEVKIDGRVIKGEPLTPAFWPTEKTRRYY